MGSTARQEMTTPLRPKSIGPGGRGECLLLLTTTQVRIMAIAVSMEQSNRTEDLLTYFVAGSVQEFSEVLILFCVLLNRFGIENQ